MMIAESHENDAPGQADAVANHANDDQAHDDGEALGPVDVTAWGAGALGVVLGLVIAFCFVLATSGVAAG